jgi:hypothetical protein
MVVEVVLVVEAGGAGAVGAVPKKNVRGDRETMGGWTVRRVGRVVVGGAVVGRTMGAVVGLGRLTVGTVRGIVVGSRVVPDSVGWAVVAAAARSAGADPVPTRTAANPAAAAPASTRLTTTPSRQRTPSIVAVVEAEPGAPRAAQSAGGGGSEGRVTWSPGSRRLGSAGSGRLGRLTCTTCHQ